MPVSGGQGGLVIVRSGIGYFAGQLRSQGASRPTGSGVTDGWVHFDTANGKLEYRGGGAWHTIAQNIADIEDVVITSVAEGDILVYDGDNQEWQNVAVGSDYEQIIAQASAGPGVAWAKQHPVIMLKKTSTSANITSDTDAQWDTSSFKDSTYTHSTSTDSEQITLGEDGLYRITYLITGSVDTTGIASSRLQVDTGSGFGLLDNSTIYASLSAVSARFTLAYSHVHDLNASDVIKVTLSRHVAGQWDCLAGRITVEQIRRV